MSSPNNELTATGTNAVVDDTVDGDVDDDNRKDKKVTQSSSVKIISLQQTTNDSGISHPVPQKSSIDSVDDVEGCNDGNKDGGDEKNNTTTVTKQTSGTDYDNTNRVVMSSRPLQDKKNDLSHAIPRKKRPRLEDDHDKNQFDHNGSDEDEEVIMPMDVSLSQLKRQVLGRDLKVDNDDNEWEEDEEDTEIRQIRALMNRSSSYLSSTKEEDRHPVEACGENSRKLPSSSTDQNDGTDNKIDKDKSSSASSSSLPEKLRNDFTCLICHEIVYPPVCLMCGHTFCQPCIDWWFDHDQTGRCPTCRRTVIPINNNRQHHDDEGEGYSSRSNTTPNLALKACIMAMFGPEIVVRLQNKKLLRKPKGERGGAHNAGYQIISELRDETWHYVETDTTTTTVSMMTSGVDFNTNASSTSKYNPPATGIKSFVQIRRSVVLDADDQRMQLALAVYQKPIKEVRAENDDDDNYNGSSRGCFRVQLCLLTMEEDEAADSGFPTNVTTPEDELLMCGNGCSRFLYSTLDVQMKDDNGRISPLARLCCDSNGCFNYVLDPTHSAGNPADIRVLLFIHSETGTQLEINLAQLQNRAGGNTLSSNCRPNNRRARFYDDEDVNFEKGRDDESEEEEAENQEEFEEDGFVVGENDESDMEDAGENDESDMEGVFSDGDEDDRCVICNDGGELMICEGGEDNIGCGKSFHWTCVDRRLVPDGDWICQACARVANIEAGPIGHEFPVAKENSNKTVEAHEDDGNDDGDGDDIRNEETNEKLLQQDIDCEDTPVVKPSANSNNNNKRRFVLEDSDSD